jgi:exopolyphosphatase/guanosine-5'-triphosphate,3'-diphosphate pyrophosphatase
MSKNTAIIDLGTNTFQLLVASYDSNEGKIQVLENIQRAVQLGKGAMLEGIIQEDALQRTRQAINEFKEISSEYQVTSIEAVGTSIIRNAKNSDELIYLIEIELGIPVSVISGEDEAEFIFQGIIQSLPDNWSTTSLVMDIGGGSVEFILFSEGNMIWRASFELGGLKLQSIFNVDAEFHSSLRIELETFVKEHLKELFVEAKKYQPQVLIGAAGAFETIWDLEKSKKGIVETKLNSFQKLDIEIFDTHMRLIEDLSFQDRVNIPGMKKFRASIFPYTNVLIEVVLNELNINQMYVSNFSLKEGFYFSKVISSN